VQRLEIIISETGLGSAIALRMTNSWLCLVLALSACSNGRGGDFDLGDTSPSSSSGGFSLKVVDATTHPWLPQFSRPHRTLVLVTVAIHNDSAPAISTVPTLFSLRTKNALQVTSENIALVDNQCLDVSVARGGSLSCKLLFALPLGEAPGLLEYDNLTGQAASAPIRSVTSGACEDIADIRTECRQCLTDKTRIQGCPSLSTCTQAEAVCMAHALYYPGNPCTDATCSLSQACSASFKALIECATTACADSCP